MKTEQGLVIEVVDKTARIQVGRHSDCTSCGACPSSQHIIIMANNDLGAAVGQRVTFEQKEVNILQGAFMVFAMPIIAAFIGAVLGRFIGESYGYDLTYATIIGGSVLFLISLAGVKIFDRAVAKDQSTKPVIVSILS